MQNLGFVRRVDPLGRIVLPIDIRKTLNIEEKDPLEFFLDGDLLILKKYSPSCVFCGNSQDIILYKGKNICSSCSKEIFQVNKQLFPR